MYDQLVHLEKIILDVKKQHQLVSSELNHLKQQPNTDPKVLSALKTQLNNSMVECTAYKKQLHALDGRYKSLAEAHRLLNTEQEAQQQLLLDIQQQHKALQQRNNELEKQNHTLHEKNKLASERTQIVLNRLTRISQPDNE